MHKYIILFFLVSVFLFSCQNEKVPDNLIKPDRMVALLTDLHLVDGKMYGVQQAPDSLYKYGEGRYLALFKKFHTDSNQFKNSLQYYTAHSVQLTAMYDKVLDKLKQKTDSLNKLQMKQQNAHK